MPSRLSLTHLRLLVALHGQGSLTQAANSLALSQSAASHQVREMERRLGVQLFERRRNRLSLTPIGERVLAAASQIVEQAGELERDIEIARSQIDVRVRVGTGALGSHWWLASFLAQLDGDLSALQIELVSDAGRLPLAALRSGIIDIALSPGTYVPRDVCSHELFHDELVGVIARSHELATRPFLEADDLAQGTYVTYSPVHEEGFEYDCVMRPADRMPGQIMLAGSADACLALVRSGLGITCLPRSVIPPGAFLDELCLLPLTVDSVKMTWRALLRRDQSEDSPAWQLTEKLAAWSRDCFPKRCLSQVKKVLSDDR